MKQASLRPITRWVLFLGVVAMILGNASWAQEPNHVSFTLSACRNDGTIKLPIGGFFVCPDQAYTTGNLGKGWNELDLVPHRLLTDSGNQADATTDYQIAIAGDGITGGKLGWDVIGGVVSGQMVPRVTGDASCSATWGAQSTLGDANDPFGGGTDTVIYRILNVHQNKNTKCTIEWTQRLALGAHLYPGSSLQSYMATTTDLSGSKKTLSIPVNQILPQSLAKTMEATQLEGTPYSWTLKKTPTPASVTFQDTCNVENPKDIKLSVKLEWTQVPGEIGKVNVTTHVSATNPSARTITVSVTDVIKEGSTPIGSKTTTTDVPANTTMEVLTHTESVTPGDPNFSDVATATYIDKDTGIPVPGNTTATASATVQLSQPADSSATIKDTEAMASGSPFEFSTDSTTPLNYGAFLNGYLEGTKVPSVYSDPVVWNSVESSSGQVVFNKTVYVGGPLSATSSLGDTAVALGEGAKELANASASINIVANAYVNLTINKTVDLNPLGATFDFEVLDAQSNVVKTASITIAQGSKTGSATVTGLMPGVEYTVHEKPNASYTSADDQKVKVTLPSCSNSVSFENKLVGKDLTVTKTAVPSFARTYLWKIDKAVDKTKVISSTPVTFNYTVNVAQTGVVDSSWKVTGKITVNNPNGFDVTGVNVTDSINNGGSCTVVNGTNVTVPASSNVALDYECTYASQPGSYSGTNTASVTWSNIGSPNTSATGTANADFSAVTPSPSTNKTVNVTDTIGGALGSVTASDVAPFTTATFQYTKEFPVPAACTTYPNTATITETGQSDSENVEVCKPLQIIIIKYSKGGTATFSFVVQGPSPFTPSITTAGSPNGSGTWNSGAVLIGNYVVSENLLSGWLLTDFVCDRGTAGPLNMLTGVPTNWSFSLDYGQTATCTFTNTARYTTRTQGFWGTHTVLANYVWNNAVIPGGDAVLCTGNTITAVPLKGQNQLMGGFWSGISKTSTNAARSTLDQQRMQFLQQYFAAVLNQYMFGSAPPMPLATARAAYCSNNLSAINAATQAMAVFNTSGDSGQFTPGMSATSQASRSQANIPFWDVTYR